MCGVQLPTGITGPYFFPNETIKSADYNIMLQEHVINVLPLNVSCYRYLKKNGTSTY